VKQIDSMAKRTVNPSGLIPIAAGPPERYRTNGTGFSNRREQKYSRRNAAHFNRLPFGARPGEPGAAVGGHPSGNWAAKNHKGGGGAVTGFIQLDDQRRRRAEGSYAATKSIGHPRVMEMAKGEPLRFFKRIDDHCF
jgi:hypothetical protein